MNRYFCEFLGTFALIFFGCGTLLFMRLEVGMLGVALAFGLTVVAMAYTIGPVSGAHLNPAVSLGFLVSRRFGLWDFVAYVFAQSAGAIAAAGTLYLIATDKLGGYDIATEGFAQNGWGAYGMKSAFLFEFISSFLFVTVFLKSTAEDSGGTLAGFAIGLTLIAIHLAGITVSGASVNPARSLGPALFAGEIARAQLWLYIFAPMLGAIAAGLLQLSGILAFRPTSNPSKREGTTFADRSRADAPRHYRPRL
ncbi:MULTISPECIES: aquaporin [Rhizobium]|uniref:Aquaporin n=2 Tax=Rhizobium TaxID=379 RepID=A0A387FZ65_9HYPH|nr:MULTISPECIES: aquaporin [Rhizobium]AYG63959.1 aquaporin [Rhizobium jaguaris]MDL2402896.1 aquaporin [Rhizobium mayense]